MADRPITTTPGAAFLSPLDLVAQLESGDRNIPQGIRDINTIRGTPAGGNFQIIDPTWRIFAPKAGVDLATYPTAMSAPRSVQAQVASAIPFNQWGPRTVAGVKAKYPWIDTSQTLGAIQSKAGADAPAPAPGPIGPTPSGPIDPSIIAHGGTSPPIPTTPGTTINSNPVVAAITSGQVGDLAKNLRTALGKPDDDGKDQGQQDMRPPQPIGPPAQAQNVSPLLHNPQIYAQRMAALNQPMTWGAAPPGQMFGTGYGPQNQPVYGTSLMSLLNDPAYMNQTAGGYG